MSFKKARAIWVGFFIVVAFGSIGVQQGLAAFGIEFSKIAHLWRYGLLGLGLVLGVAVVILQTLEKQAKSYFVRIRFQGEMAPAPMLELNLPAHSEDEARAKANDYARELLHRDGLVGSVLFQVVEVRPPQ